VKQVGEEGDGEGDGTLVGFRCRRSRQEEGKVRG
jgi:hypothetical protein